MLRAPRLQATPEEERDGARANLVRLLDRMEDALKPSGWLVGKSYSIADIAATLSRRLAPLAMSGLAGAAMKWFKNRKK